MARRAPARARRGGARPAATPLQPTWTAVRARIDAIDEQIQRLINERARLAQQVGISKSADGRTVDFYRPEREAQVLRAARERNAGPLRDEEVLRLFREIMSACLAQQEPLKVAFLGPEGTFTQTAVLNHFGHSVRALPLPPSTRCSTRSRPAAPTSASCRSRTPPRARSTTPLDRFLSSPLKICGEVELRIHQHLMGRMSSLARIERICSHPQSLAQCRGWLEEHLPEVEQVPVSSNAEGARRARDEKGTAAIAGETAARGLRAQGAGRARSRTAPTTPRASWCSAASSSPPSGEDRTTLLVSVGHTDAPGALLSPARAAGAPRVSMTRIESRPSRRRKWDYVFFIDFEGHAEDPHVAQGARGAQAARLAVPHARLLPAGGAVSDAEHADACGSLPGGEVSGRVHVPGDKSISHRALMLGAIAEGDTRDQRLPRRRGLPRDARAPCGALGVRDRAAGAAGIVEVHGCRRAGAAGRRRAARHGQRRHRDAPVRWACSRRSASTRTLIGDASLMRRPMERVAVPLRADGGAHPHAGRAARRCRSRPARPLSAIDYALPVASAQVKSALLLAALGARGRSSSSPSPPPRAITPSACSPPSVSRLACSEGRTVAHRRRPDPSAADVAVPGDFSSAAFFLVAGCLAARGTLVIANVGVNPTRTGLIEMLRHMGADIRLHDARSAARPSPSRSRTSRSAPRRCTASACPSPSCRSPIDEFPVFFIAAACASGETLVRGARELRVKESDRLAAMAAGLERARRREPAAARRAVDPGRDGFGGGTIDSHGDHRIAMAFAVAALKARAPIESSTSPTSPPPSRALPPPRARPACRS